MSHTALVCDVSAALESQIAELDPKDRPEFLESAGLKEPGLFSVIRAGYKILDLLTFFTAGKVEVRAWTTFRGARALADDLTVLSVSRLCPRCLAAATARAAGRSERSGASPGPQPSSRPG